MMGVCHGDMYHIYRDSANSPPMLLAYHQKIEPDIIDVSAERMKKCQLVDVLATVPKRTHAYYIQNT